MYAMADEALDPVAPPSSLSEFRAAKAAKATGNPAPPADKPAPAVEKSETAGESATPKQEPQEKTEPKPRAKTAEERAAELRAAGRTKEADKILADAAEKQEYEQWKAGKADREREAEELRQLRARQASAAAPPAPAPVAPAAPSPAAESDKPKLKDYLTKPENKDVPYDEVVEQWEDAVSTWREAKREAKSKAESTHKTVAEREEAARKAHPDYDQVMKGQNFVDTIHQLHRDAVVAAALELPNGTEVLYRLAKDPTECRRIAGLSQWSQVIELGVMSRAIAAESEQQKPPEQPKQPVPISRTPPPPRSLSGIAPPETKDTGKPPSSLSEHRARKVQAS